MSLFAPLAPRGAETEWLGRKPSDWIKLKKMTGGAWDALPFGIFEAELVLRRPDVRAYFALDLGRCTFLRGDIQELKGVAANFRLEEAHALAQFNALMLAHGESPRFDSDDRVVDYAVGVLRLISPSPDVRLLRQLSDIPQARPQQTPGRPSRATAKDPKFSIRKPSVVRGRDLIRIEIDMWENVGGVVSRIHLLLFPDGRVATSRTEIATGVGNYIPFLARL